MMKYRAIIEYTLLFFALIVFYGESKIDKERQTSDLLKNAAQNDDEIDFPVESVNEDDELSELVIENSTSTQTTERTETTTAANAALPASNESSTTVATSSKNIDLVTTNLHNTSGNWTTDSTKSANESEVSTTNAINIETDGGNAISYQNSPKNNTDSFVILTLYLSNSTCKNWSSILTKKFWEDHLYDQNYVLAILLPIAAGISLALIVVCACCVLNKLCERQQNNKIDKKNYYGRNVDSDKKWMLLAPSSSDEEI